MPASFFVRAKNFDRLYFLPLKDSQKVGASAAVVYKVLALKSSMFSRSTEMEGSAMLCIDQQDASDDRLQK